jgi:hypothetical protein
VVVVLVVITYIHTPRGRVVVRSSRERVATTTAAKRGKKQKKLREEDELWRREE